MGDIRCISAGVKIFYFLTRMVGMTLEIKTPSSVDAFDFFVAKRVAIGDVDGGFGIVG